MGDFTLMCRVCMSQNKNLTNIFSSASGFSQIYTVVMECAPIQIAPGDNLPSFICEQCINNLDIAYRFRGQCVQTDVILRQCLNQICDVKDEPDCDDNKDELPEEPKLNIETAAEPSAPSEERNNKSVMPFGLCEIIMANDLLKGTDTKVEAKRVKKEKTKPAKIENEVKKTGKKKRIRARPGPKREKFDYSGIKERTDGRWQCDLCENHYKSKYHLKRHKISHIPELSTIRCELCGKTFTRNAHLKMHRGTHTGEKSCSCELCGKTFYSVNSLAAHRRIHLGLKPYKCKFCPKAFTQNKTLQNHTRTHTGERPFVCETCGKSFNRNHHLTTHKTIHTNEKNNSTNRNAARVGYGEIKISPTMNAVHEQKMKLNHTNFISHNDEVYQSLHLDQKKDLF